MQFDVDVTTTTLEVVVGEIRDRENRSDTETPCPIEIEIVCEDRQLQRLAELCVGPDPDSKLLPFVVPTVILGVEVVEVVVLGLLRLSGNSVAGVLAEYPPL